MRFIGSKANLLGAIDGVIGRCVKDRAEVFCDIFSGTGVVARYFKPRYEIISNDLLHFSYVIQKATIENNAIPTFPALRAAGIADPFAFLEETPVGEEGYADERYFITRHYTPHEGCSRMYLSNKNALRIDFIRNTLEDWRGRGLLAEDEYYYLLAGLVQAVPQVSNITGTYGAYLKHWDKRTYKDLELVRMDVADNHRRNRCYNRDANELMGQVEGDILYLDPPYNKRQYAPNYHLLETISRYDRPDIHGVTGIRPYAEQKSPFCVRSEVADALEDLVSKAKFRHIVMSYSTDGLLNCEEIERILKKHGVAAAYHREVIPYRQYRSKRTKKSEQLCEYLFYIQKDLPARRTVDLGAGRRKTPAPAVDTQKYLKSPMNYIGGKYKLLPQILPCFPARCGTFVDLFAGGCNVAVNVQAEHILCNDLNQKVIELFEALRQRELAEILARIEAKIEEYGLSKENEAGFLRFRDDYNRAPDPIDLYTLTCYSFNYQFRFNNRLEYNNPFGRDRSQFSENMRHNLIAFVTRLKELDIEFCSKDFTQVPLDGLGPGDFIYCDPPYLITTGTYNDGNRGFKDWKEEQERALYAYLDAADARGIRFALSNVVKHKGKTNGILLEWAKKYRVIDLDYSYANASYNTSKGKSREVLVVNYEKGEER